MEGEGFEPSKALPADLQSAPFGHSGTPPQIITTETVQAGDRTRTNNRLLTKQLLYQLSYASSACRSVGMGN